MSPLSLFEAQTSWFCRISPHTSEADLLYVSVKPFHFLVPSLLLVSRHSHLSHLAFPFLLSPNLNISVFQFLSQSPHHHEYFFSKTQTISVYPLSGSPLSTAWSLNARRAFPAAQDVGPVWTGRFTLDCWPVPARFCFCTSAQPAFYSDSTFSHLFFWSGDLV